MLGYTMDDLDKMSNAVHNAYKYISTPEAMGRGIF